MSQQRARRIGMGMKPRGEEEVLPTTEGQEVVSNDTPNDVQDVTVEGGDLKSVVAEIPAESLAEEPRLHETEIVDPLAAALKASAVEVFQKAYEEIKFPNPPSHMHVMGIDLARGDDKTVASVTDEDGNVRILSEAEMDAFVEKTKAAFTEQVEEEINPRTFIQPQDDEIRGFQVFTRNGVPLTGIISQEELKQFMAPPRLMVDKIDREALAKLDIHPGTRISYTPRQPQMGQLESGEYRSTVRVPEGYIAGVQSQAQADDLSLEDWLTRELAQQLEARFYGRL